ncbi:MAG: hypothetical protein NVS3B24_07190 [Candidatus Dormibacteria bacterium]
MALLLACAAAIAVPLAALAEMPWPGAPGVAQRFDYQAYLRAHVVCPPAGTNQNPVDYDCTDWHVSSQVDPQAGTPARSAQELGGVMGGSLDKAYNVSTGRPDIHIAVLDSGIMWDDGAMADLRNKVALNWAELPPPVIDSAGHTSCDGVTLPPRNVKLPSPGFPPCYDADNSGAFTVDDYARDPRVNPASVVAGGSHEYFCHECITVQDGPFNDTNVATKKASLLTPEDLIEVFSCFDASLPADRQVGRFTGVDSQGRPVCSNGAEHADNDGNGFPHDIAGWNFMERTNDPYDEPHYGHGTGEARDSNAEGNSIATQYHYLDSKGVKQTGNSGGDIGTCPSCMVVPLKVGDSFIADVNEFNQAVMYGVDNQVNIIQSALGTLNSSDLTQASIDYAYRNGVTFVASAADEAAGHHNQPGATENHAIVVNSVRKNEVDPPGPPSGFPNLPVGSPGRTYLLMNGCTNYGGHIIAAVESASCSSEAVGRESGTVGLIYSVARNMVKQGQMTQYAPPTPLHPDGVDISPEEVKQVIAGTADNIDFEDSTPPVARGDSPADPTSPCASVPVGAPGSPDGPGIPNNYSTTNAGERYRSIAGWSQYFGYGRANANCQVRAVLARRIPPEASIETPSWFENLDTTVPSFAVTGRVAATRTGGRYRYRVQVAYGVQPHEEDFQAINIPVSHPGVQTGPISGTLATLTREQLDQAFANYNPVTYALNHPLANPNGDQADWLAPPYTNATTPGRNQWDQYTFTLRLQVTALDGSDNPIPGLHVGEDRKSLQHHHDDSVGASGTAVPGFPKKYNSDGGSEPVLADLLGDNQNELIFGSSTGLIHALRADGSELPGWPVHTTPLCSSALPDSSTCPSREREPAFRDPILGPVAANSYAAVLRTVAVGDLDRTGRLQVVAADNAGYVYVYEASAAYCASIGKSAPCVRPNFPVHVDFRYSRQGVPGRFNRDVDNRVQFGFFGSPALADLNGDGKLEIIDGSLDRHVYVWKGDGSRQPGFPLLLASADKVAKIDSGTHRVHLKPGSGALYGSKIVSGASIGDLLGDGKKEIVIGRNEEYAASRDGGWNASADSAGTLGSVVGNLANLANGRTYALFSDGYCHGLATCPAEPPDLVATNSYVPGWPVKVGILQAELLPTVGSGIDTPPALISMSCPQNSSKGLKVGVAADNGPVYIFGSDGTSCYGQGPGLDNGVIHDRTVSTAAPSGNSTDPVAAAAFGLVVFGDLSSAGDTVVVTPTAGTNKLLDVILAGHQFNAQNSISAWSLSNVPPACVAADCAPQFHPGYPHYMNDLMFLAGPAVGDITGDGSQAILQGSASNDLRAVDRFGMEVPGWSKNTGDWTVDTPVIGTLGTTLNKRVASLTRDGRLFVWNTTAGACAPASWPKARHDNWNSSEYETRAGRPSTINDLAGTREGGSVKLTFTAPHGDLFCGDSKGYEVRYSTTGPITDANWSQATRVSGSSLTLAGANGTAGTAGSACQPQGAALSAVPTSGPVWVAVQGVNDATRRDGNLGAISNVAYFPGASSTASAPTASSVNNACSAADHGLPNTSRQDPAIDLSLLLLPVALVLAQRRRRRHLSS